MCPGETRVTGLFHDRQVAKKAIEELKGAGFEGDLITIAMPGGSEDDPLIEQTGTRSAEPEAIHSLHDLSAEDVVIMVDADKRAAEALDIICLLYTSPSPRDRQKSRMPSSA